MVFLEQVGPFSWKGLLVVLEALEYHREEVVGVVAFQEGGVGPQGVVVEGVEALQVELGVAFGHRLGAEVVVVVEVFLLLQVEEEVEVEESLCLGAEVAVVVPFRQQEVEEVVVVFLYPLEVEAVVEGVGVFLSLQVVVEVLVVLLEVVAVAAVALVLVVLLYRKAWFDVMSQSSGNKFGLGKGQKYK